MSAPNRNPGVGHLPPPFARSAARFGTPGDLLAVAAGGAIGTLLRGTSLALAPLPTQGLPWVTASENLVGAFLLGLLSAFLLRRMPGAPRLHLFLTTGVLGAFTTFSALATDVILLSGSSAGPLLALYLTLSLPGGVAAAWAGVALGHRIPIGHAESTAR